MLDRLRNYIKDEEFRINIFGNKVNIINYLDLIVLEDTRISLQSPKGIVVIKGSGLTVNRLLDNEILISGKIKTIELE